MRLVWFALLVSLVWFVPVAQAGPVERACHVVVDNPFAPLLARCEAVGEHEEAAQAAFARVCHHAFDVLEDVDEGFDDSCRSYGLILSDPVAAWNMQCRWLNGNPEDVVPEVDCYV